MREDPILKDRVLIAEPWDIGPGGYQLGNFRSPFLEWSDRYRDDVRRFWRGDRGMVGALATTGRIVRHFSARWLADDKDRELHRGA
jgi:glycogen operon protein